MNTRVSAMRQKQQPSTHNAKEASIKENYGWMNENCTLIMAPLLTQVTTLRSHNFSAGEKKKCCRYEVPMISHDLPSKLYTVAVIQ